MLMKSQLLVKRLGKVLNPVINNDLQTRSRGRPKKNADNTTPKKSILIHQNLIL
jgi:hypothetical protein